jgi:hypothetical protein
VQKQMELLFVTVIPSCSVNSREVVNLDRKCLGQKSFRESGATPLMFAADAELWGLNRLSPVIDRNYISWRNRAKVKKANKNKKVKLKRLAESSTRSARPASGFGGNVVN